MFKHNKIKIQEVPPVADKANYSCKKNSMMSTWFQDVSQQSNLQNLSTPETSGSQSQVLLKPKKQYCPAL